MDPDLFKTERSIYQSLARVAMTGRPDASDKALTKNRGDQTEFSSLHRERHRDKKVAGDKIGE
jgi:hypothetical protein